MNWKLFREGLESCMRQFGEIAGHVGAALVHAQAGQYDKAIDKLGDVLAECRDVGDELESLIKSLKEALRD